MELNKLRDELRGFFTGLEFNEEYHSYTKDGIPLTPVTNYIKTYVRPFDRLNIAKHTAKKRGISIEEVLAEWDKKRDDSCTLGNQIHKFAETYEKGNIPSIPQEEAVIKFFADLPDFILPVFSEFKIYSVFYKLAGTMDKLLYNSLTKNFIIVDYKTNGDIEKNFKGQRLLAPFNNLLDTPFNHYQLQLSLYQLIFELTGHKVERRRIVWFREDGMYQIMDTSDYTQILKKFLPC